MGTRKYFGTDGIRGRVGEGPISADFMLRLGHAGRRVVLCRRQAACRGGHRQGHAHLRLHVRGRARSRPGRRRRRRAHARADADACRGATSPARCAPMPASSFRHRTIRMTTTASSSFPRTARSSPTTSSWRSRPSWTSRSRRSIPESWARPCGSRDAHRPVTWKSARTSVSRHPFAGRLEASRSIARMARPTRSAPKVFRELGARVSRDRRESGRTEHQRGVGSTHPEAIIAPCARNRRRPRHRLRRRRRSRADRGQRRPPARRRCA